MTDKILPRLSKIEHMKISSEAAPQTGKRNGTRVNTNDTFRLVGLRLSFVIRLRTGDFAAGYGVGSGVSCGVDSSADSDVGSGVGVGSNSRKSSRPFSTKSSTA